MKIGFTPQEKEPAATLLYVNKNNVINSMENTDRNDQKNAENCVHHDRDESSDEKNSSGI